MKEVPGVTSANQSPPVPNMVDILSDNVSSHTGGSARPIDYSHSHLAVDQQTDMVTPASISQTIASNEAVKSVAEASILTGGNRIHASTSDMDQLGFVGTTQADHRSIHTNFPPPIDTLSDPADSAKDLVLVSLPSIQLAAIDNGLAFPFKHPDQWRSYPYGWMSLPAARVSFSKATRDRLLPLLTSRKW